MPMTVPSSTPSSRAAASAPVPLPTSRKCPPFGRLAKFTNAGARRALHRPIHSSYAAGFENSAIVASRNPMTDVLPTTSILYDKANRQNQTLPGATAASGRHSIAREAPPLSEQCLARPLMATPRHAEHVRVTTAVPPTPDLRAQMPAIVSFLSGLPSGPDVPLDAGKRQGMTQSRHSGSPALLKTVRTRSRFSASLYSSERFKFLAPNSG